MSDEVSAPDDRTPFELVRDGLDATYNMLERFTINGDIDDYMHVDDFVTDLTRDGVELDGGARIEVTGLHEEPADVERMTWTEYSELQQRSVDARDYIARCAREGPIPSLDGMTDAQLDRNRTVLRDALRWLDLEAQSNRRKASHDQKD